MLGSMMYPLNVNVGWAHHEEFKKAGKDVIAKTLTVLEGECGRCGGKVARFIENE